MKKTLYLLVLLAGFFASAQVKIGTNPTTLGASSLLELESADKPLLIPRVANTAAVTSPTNGMIIFDISMQCVRGYANGVWTDCALRNTPACTAPSGLAVASSAGNSINIGGTTNFSLSGANISSSSWSISPTTGVSVTSGTGSPTGTITFSSAGTYTITYVASSSGGSCSTSTASATGTVTVTTPACPAPSGLAVASSAGGNIITGGTTSFTLSGSNISSSSWSISPTAGVSVTSGTGSPTGNITFSTDGTYTITYVASSTGSCSTATANATASVTVASTPPCPVPSGLAVASSAGGGISTGGTTSFSLSGSNISSSSWSISPTTGVSITSGTGSPTGNITFATPGTYTITYVASSTGACTTATANATASVTVSTTPPCPTPSGLAVASSAGGSINTGSSTNFTLTGTDISSATWTAPGGSPSSGTGTSTGAITYSSSGSYTVTFVASSTGSCITTTANAAGSVTVSTPNCPTPSGLSVASSAGGSINTGSPTSFTLSGSNISSATWSISPTTGVSVTSGTGTPTGNITFSTAGTYTITYVASSTGGFCNTTTANATASVTVVKVCGALIAAGVFKNFMCHNLGADTSLDPDVPVQGIHGNYYQWGNPTVVANAYSTTGAIAGWHNYNESDGSWINAGKNGNDPCPAGYRIPSATEWSGVKFSNSSTAIGSFVNNGNFTSALQFGTSLTLPAAGVRVSIDGLLNNRGNGGTYWSNTEVSGGSYAYNMTFSKLSSINSSVGFGTRATGASIRCIQE